MPTISISPSANITIRAQYTRQPTVPTCRNRETHPRSHQEGWSRDDQAAEYNASTASISSLTSFAHLFYHDPQAASADPSRRNIVRPGSRRTKALRALHSHHSEKLLVINTDQSCSGKPQAQAHQPGAAPEDMLRSADRDRPLRSHKNRSLICAVARESWFFT